MNDDLGSLLEGVCSAFLAPRGLALQAEAKGDLPFLLEIYRQLREAEFSFLLLLLPQSS